MTRLRSAACRRPSSLTALMYRRRGGRHRSQHLLRPTTITAYFTSATAIYPGDKVRSPGSRSAPSPSIQPDGGQVRMTLAVDRGVPIPADAKAVIVAQNLVAARYVQLAPAYERRGPVLADGAVIPWTAPQSPSSGTKSRPTDASGNRIGPRSSDVGHIGVAVHRQRRQRDGRQRRQAAPNPGRNFQGSGASWPTAAATSSTS